MKHQVQSIDNRTNHSIVVCHEPSGHKYTIPIDTVGVNDVITGAMGDKMVDSADVDEAAWASNALIRNCDDTAFAAEASGVIIKSTITEPDRMPNMATRDKLIFSAFAHDNATMGAYGCNCATVLLNLSELMVAVCRVCGGYAVGKGADPAALDAPGQGSACAMM